MQKTPTDRAVCLTGPTMGTTWSVRIDDPVPAAHLPELRARFQAAVDEVDGQMSTWMPDSDLMRLNKAALGEWVALPRQLLTVLAAGITISRSTGGAFEMNVGDAVRAWGFGPQAIDLAAVMAARAARRVPASEALDLDIDGARARKAAPLALDLSGIAKGYGVDRLAETAAALGLGHVLSAVDGEVRAVGTRLDGQPWAVAIDAPDAAVRGSHSVLALSDMSVATSGDYRHFVTVGAERLSHTIDPRRGAPLIHAPASVSVLSASCMVADAMATALMVMGSTEGPAFAARNAVSALFVTRAATGLVARGSGLFGAVA